MTVRHITLDGGEIDSAHYVMQLTFWNESPWRPPSVTIRYGDNSEKNLSGLLAVKWSKVVHALERYERERRFDSGIDIMDDIREALA